MPTVPPGETALYSTGFSTALESAWTTNNTSRFYWDSVGQRYHYYLVGGSAEYTYVPVSYPGGPFTLVFDILPTRTDFAASHVFGISGPNLNSSSAVGAPKVFVRYVSDVGGVHFLVTFFNAAGQSANSGYGLYANGITYRSSIQLSSTGTVSILVKRLDTGAIVLQDSISGLGSFAGMDRLYMSVEGISGGNTGAVAEGYIDNVLLSAPTSGPLGTFSELTDRMLQFVHPVAPVVRNGNDVYVISGQIASRNVVVPQIERTTVDPSGNISPWVVAGSLGSARDQGAAAATNANIYVLGDHPGSTQVTRVPILSGGALGTEVNELPMKVARYAAQAFVHGPYLYAVGGGDNSSSPIALASVERAPINTNGTLGPWDDASVPDLNVRRRGFALVKANGYVWVLGGSGATAAVGTVERATLNPDGSIGSWQIVGEGPAQSYIGAVVQGNCIYVVGTGPGAALYGVDCVVMTDTGIGSVIAQSPMIYARYSAAVFVSSTYLYVAGGVGPTQTAENGWRTTERASL